MTVRDYGHWAIHVGDCRDTLATMAPQSVQAVVTSPPYFGLRDYGHEQQIGLEQTPDAFVAKLVEVFREVRRVLRDDGTLWLNLGDSYAGAGYSNHANTGGAMREDGGKQKHLTGSGLKNKDLIGIPWRVAFALQSDGWYLRQDIIWHKPNPMPESVRDRCTKAHEYIFLLSKNERYYWDAEAMQEPAVYNGSQRSQKRGEFGGKGQPKGREPFRAVRETRNRRSVWTVTTRPFKGAHFATYPEQLIEPCVAASTRPGDLVLDPFGGAGTTGLVALKQGRRAVMCELNPAYADIAERRIATALYGEGFFG